MLFKSCSLSFLAIFLVGTPLALAGRHDKPIKARIRFLADSTIVRSGYGENEDVYLVMLTAERGESKAVLARLVDQYPPSGAPISTEALMSEEAVRFQVRRDRRRDIAYGDLVLRTRPGDPFAILPERLGFRPDMSTPIDPGDVLPFYRTVRH